MTTQWKIEWLGEWGNKERRESEGDEESIVCEVESNGATEEVHRKRKREIETKSLSFSASKQIFTLLVMCQPYFPHHCVCVCVFTCVSSVCVRQASGQHLFCWVTTKGRVHVCLCVKICVNRKIASIVGSLNRAVCVCVARKWKWHFQMPQCLQWQTILLLFVLSDSGSTDRLIKPGELKGGREDDRHSSG